MKKRHQIILLLLLIFTFSCEKDKPKEEIIKMTIASEKKINSYPENNPSQDLFRREEYWAKYKEFKTWTPFPIEIKDFEYEEGYEYVIVIRQKEWIPRPMDAGKYQYFLMEVVSKEKKQSEGLNKD